MLIRWNNRLNLSANQMPSRWRRVIWASKETPCWSVCHLSVHQALHRKSDISITGVFLGPWNYSGVLGRKECQRSVLTNAWKYLVQCHQTLHPLSTFSLHLGCLSPSTFEQWLEPPGGRDRSTTYWLWFWTSSLISLSLSHLICKLRSRRVVIL